MSSIGLKSGLSRESTPPVNVVFLEEGLGLSGCVRRVVIFDRTAIRKSFSDEWNKRGL